MPRRIGFIAAWTMVTLVAVAIAAQAVGTVRDQVTNRPSPIVDISALAPTTITTALSETSTTTSTLMMTTTSTTSAPAATSTTTTIVADTTTTTAPPPTTTTTTSPPPTTTTTTPPQMTTETHEMVGGWVKIRYGNGEVFLDGAGANAGFTMDVEHNGPKEVEVEFRSENHESKFSADWDDGELRVKIEEEGDEGDHHEG